MTDGTKDDRKTDAPAPYATARRPGQSGEEGERRAGPSPLSANPTGPHAPYEATDPDGLAAAKHVREPTEASAGHEPAPLEKKISENISVLGEDR